jgi:hypothetical protein
LGGCALIHHSIFPSKLNLGVSYEPTLTLRVIPPKEKPNRLMGHTCLSGIIALTHSKSKTVIGIGAFIQSPFRNLVLIPV